MGLLWELIKLNEEIDEENKEKKKLELEKEMNNYGLDEYEKELVRNGEYEPWNFEGEDDLEEDDYYYEDDK